MPETQNIEYKITWRDEYLKWICGFDNAKGGKITNKDYQGINSIGKTTATEDLSELVKLKLLKPSGVKECPINETEF